MWIDFRPPAETAPAQVTIVISVGHKLTFKLNRATFMQLYSVTSRGHPFTFTGYIQLCETRQYRRNRRNSESRPDRLLELPEKLGFQDLEIPRSQAEKLLVEFLS
ncbi:predicted protein [Histoplasma capsulatum var. duboisii H88]|uniref:Predicted protein n=2 Tax=Ajellomyces capsulatus TaxID=5037 RepID=F0U6U3_AJEC8|nr:predicted protein [Histoplasma capsulatum H143]EGC41522.1 predicted protein [Histoplasma capsulatum var. duboisii H88]